MRELILLALTEELEVKTDMLIVILEKILQRVNTKTYKGPSWIRACISEG
jgi:hypothetical protein